MAKAKTLSAAAGIIATARENATTRGKRCWVSQLPADTRGVLEDLKAQYDAGECAGIQLTDLHRSAKEKLGIIIGYEQFRRWLIGDWK